MKITLKGEPKSTNRLYKYVCRGRFPQGYMSPEGMALKDDYMWQAKQQMKGKRMFTEPLKVTIETYHGTKRKCDWDNFHKLSMDAMSGLVYEDDSQILIATVMKMYDKDNPRIEIDIQPI